MSLCLAISLVVRGDYDGYDQLVRYKWWFRDGYMSSTGACFDIGAATRNALVEFEARQRDHCEKYQVPKEEIDYLCLTGNSGLFKTNCGKKDAAGNGSLMRLAPVPLFFFRHPPSAVRYAGESSLTTHGDPRASDACRFYSALIVAALHGEHKDDLLSSQFLRKHQDWFAGEKLTESIMEIANGSYKNKPRGYDDGIRGKGFVGASLEAALWVFYNDDNSFERGALAAVNLGDDTDTTAAIYGQLAGAYYGFPALPSRWSRQVYAEPLIRSLSEWLLYRGEEWATKKGVPLAKL